MDERSVERRDNAMKHTDTIHLKGIIDEDFINYKVPSMTLISPTCTLKCDIEYGEPICQNSSLVSDETPVVEVKIKDLCERYINNKITKAIVFQGLEPMDSFNELYAFVVCLRIKYHCEDPVVIYTGYDKREILDKLTTLVFANNIIVKYGRFIPNQKPHFDEVLGVSLASNNQYAEQLE